MTLEDLAELTARLEGVLAGLEKAQVRHANEDEWLTIEQVADITKYSNRWLYDHASQLPFIKRVSGSLRASRIGLQQWMATRPRA